MEALPPGITLDEGGIHSEGLPDDEKITKSFLEALRKSLNLLLR